MVTSYALADKLCSRMDESAMSAESSTIEPRLGAGSGGREDWERGRRAEKFPNIFIED